MDRQYAAAYPKLYRCHWWWRAREDFLVNVLSSELGNSREATILDVGCGAGLFFRRAQELGEIHGVESDFEMQTGRAEIDTRIHWGTLDSFEPECRYDAILFLDVLEHVPNPEHMLHSALRLLNKHGIVIATVPAFRSLWTKHDDINQHLERYTKQTFVRVTEAAGLTTKSVRYFFHWVFPAKLLIRGIEAIRSRSSIANVPSVPWHPINRALYYLSRFEQVLALDRALPFGSSLLYVGMQADVHAKPPSEHI